MWYVLIIITSPYVLFQQTSQNKIENDQTGIKRYNLFCKYNKWVMREYLLQRNMVCDRKYSMVRIFVWKGCEIWVAYTRNINSANT